MRLGITLFLQRQKKNINSDFFIFVIIQSFNQYCQEIENKSYTRYEIQKLLFYVSNGWRQTVRSSTCHLPWPPCTGKQNSSNTYLAWRKNFRKLEMASDDEKVQRDSSYAWSTRRIEVPFMINIGPSSVHARVTINDLVDNNENVLESVHHSKRRSVTIYIKVHTATRWTIRHGLMLLWFWS